MVFFSALQLSSNNTKHKHVCVLCPGRKKTDSRSHRPVPALGARAAERPPRTSCGRSCHRSRRAAAASALSRWAPAGPRPRYFEQMLQPAATLYSSKLSARRVGVCSLRCLQPSGLSSDLVTVAPRETGQLSHTVASAPSFRPSVRRSALKCNLGPSRGG